MKLRSRAVAVCAAAAATTFLAPGIAQAEQIHGKAMSYNNYVDADAALRDLAAEQKLKISWLPGGIAIVRNGNAAAR